MIDRHAMIGIEDISGVVATDAEMFVSMATRAKDFLAARPWCSSIGNGYLDRGLAGVIAVFYFEVTSNDSTREYKDTWVIVGRIPPIYVPTEIASTGIEAIEEYLKVLWVWAQAVEMGEPIGDLPDVLCQNGRDLLAQTPENAAIIQRQEESLRSEILPWLREWTPQSD